MFSIEELSNQKKNSIILTAKLPNLTVGARMLMMYMLSVSSKITSENFYVCHFSPTSDSKKLNLSRRYVYDLLKELEDREYITRGKLHASATVYFIRKETIEEGSSNVNRHTKHKRSSRS